MLTDVQVSTASITVWHRKDDQAFFPFGSSDTPRVELGYTYEVPVSDLLEEAPHTNCFRLNNRVTGEEWEQPVKHGTQSLSVGDVVRVEAHGSFVYWTVEMIGWSTISEEQFVQATA